MAKIWKKSSKIWVLYWGDQQYRPVCDVVEISPDMQFLQLSDSLIRDCLVHGINDDAVCKKLLQEKKLTLSQAINICRSGKQTNTQMRDIKKPKGESEDEINIVGRQSKFSTRNGTPSSTDRCLKCTCKYCGRSQRSLFSLWRDTQSVQTLFT